MHLTLGLRSPLTAALAAGFLLSVGACSDEDPSDTTGIQTTAPFDGGLPATFVPSTVPTSSADAGAPSIPGAGTTSGQVPVVGFDAGVRLPPVDGGVPALDASPALGDGGLAVSDAGPTLDASAPMHADLGKGDGSDVVLIGDSWMSNTLQLEGTGGGISPALIKVSGQRYRNYAVQGVMLLSFSTFGPAIPSQWDAAVRANSKIKTVVMTAGGNDIIQSA
jgi:hypothetical protein